MRMIFRCDPRLADHLVRPYPARTALPDWLRTMPANAHSDIHGRDIRTVKQCPPFVDAMRHGFMLVLPCDVAVAPGMRFRWDWPLPKLACRSAPEPAASLESLQCTRSMRPVSAIIRSTASISASPAAHAWQVSKQKPMPLSPM